MVIALAAKKKYNLVEKNDRDMVIFDCQDRTKFVYQGELSDLDMNEMLAGKSGEIKRVAGRGRGVLVADREGAAVAYALFNLQERSTLFVNPGGPGGSSPKLTEKICVSHTP